MSMQISNTMSETYEHINLDYLNMMADGDAEMKKVMLGMLFDEMPEELEKLEKLCSEGNWEELSSVAHKMKSTLSFIGNDEMTNANSVLEVKTKTGEDADTFPGLVNVLITMWPKVKVELQKEHDNI